MIRTIPDDGQITEAGAYRMSMRLYHSQTVCPGPSISSSGLRRIVNESPWHFWSQWEGNPDRYPEGEPSEGLVLGKAAHSLILGDEVFDEHFIYVPDDAPRRPTKTQILAKERDGEWSKAAKPGADFWAEFDAKAAGRLLLKESQVQTIMWMSENLKRNPLAVEMLTGGMMEVSLIWQDQITGIWLKSRPDMMPQAGDFDATDLKTFAPQSNDIKHAIHKAITSRGYHMQLAMAGMGVEAIFGETANQCGLVMLQSTKPFTVTPVLLDQEALYWARVQLRHGIDTFARCLKDQDWPQPVDGILTYTLPESVLHRFGTMQAEGTLPLIERSAA
jgi:hypothetical protein